MANRAAIRDYVRQQTLLESDDWSDGKVDAVINEGLLRMSLRFDWPWLATSTSLAVVAGTTEYSLPADYAKTEALYRVGKKQRLVEVAPHEVIAVYGGDLPTGDPAAFYTFGTSLFLDKVPSASDTYTWLYYKQPSILNNDTDSPPWVEAFHLVIAHYAIARAWEREEDGPKADAAMREYDDGVDEMAQYYLNRSDDNPVVWGTERKVMWRTSSNNMPWLDDAS